MPFSLLVLHEFYKLAVNDVVPVEVRYIVPDNFRGGLVIELDKEGVPIVPDGNGIFLIKFPESGCLKTPKSEFFGRWQKESACFTSGKSLPVYPGGNNAQGLSLFSLGFLSVNGKDKFLFVVGTHNDYVEYLKRRPNFTVGSVVTLDSSTKNSGENMVTQGVSTKDSAEKDQDPLPQPKDPNRP